MARAIATKTIATLSLLALLCAVVLHLRADRPVEPTTTARATAPVHILLPGQMDDFVGPQLPDEPAPDVDQDEADDVEEEEVVEKPPTKEKRSADRGKQRRKGPRWQPAVLQVVTNFAEADVTVNGLPYPAPGRPDAPDGMVLPAGGPYSVEVKVGPNTKHYTLHLRPHETRLLLVELTNFNSNTPRPPPPKKVEPAKKEEPKPKEEPPKDGEGGQVTVYSKPAGTVISNGTETGDKTPGTVDLPIGRHELQVRYETGAVSEKKIVRVRNGSKIKLFFRER